MNDWFIKLMIVVVAIAVCVLFFALGQVRISNDCDRLGSFYLGDLTYKCERVKP